MTTTFEQGIRKVAENNAEWCDAFNAYARTLLARNGVLTADEVTEFVGMPPGHCNAVGAAMVRFARAHGMEVTGYRKTAHASRRTARIAVWGRSL